ncbi:lipid IV(A) palmitoyltransferase PagP [Rahnella rivi]|uniref:lipid IV(A) palmitoyltransferase PagP n=1 Tax=Rahnella rivi TaxID=2816249 RepID=UPI0006F2E444|nr:lipid IV(A) palmitoyltransferase PagP [Rahnella rivi]KQN68532.1 lipid A palmitoyltransferase [Serratia sp. Leaf51]MBB6115878.1 palmitoyl transferase [Rahnella inusitata]MBU9833130.1 lipid IV(A) palmitoyltransferase PagP [Rahnella rivi]
MKNNHFVNIRAVVSYSFFTLSLLGAGYVQAGESHIIPPAQAVSGQENNDGLWSTFKNNIAETWNAPQQQDLFLPVLTRHNRHTHSKKQIDGYNEHPWGGGYGVSRYDEKGNWHALYAMAFKDSFNKWEPVAGYGYEKIWQPLSDKEFRLGAGYVAAVSARDNYDYVPFPMVLPLVSAGYSRLTFQATYVPGGNSKGNVLFGWFRFQF